MKNKHIVIFKLNDGNYCLFIDDVIKIIRVVEITLIPNAPDIILGVINYQGEVIPVANIRKRFNILPKKISINDKIIISSINGRRLGLLVDSIDNIMEIEEKNVIEGEKILTGLEHLKGIVKISEDLILIIDIKDFLSCKEITKIDEVIKNID